MIELKKGVNKNEVMQVLAQDIEKLKEHMETELDIRDRLLPMVEIYYLMKVFPKDNIYDESCKNTREMVTERLYPKYFL